MRNALFAALGLALLPGCPLLDVEVEVPEVCIAYDEIQVDGLPIELDGSTTVRKSFVVDDLGAFHELTDHDADVSFARAQLLALTGITDFTFVEAARITISSGEEGSTLPPLVLYACDGDCVKGDGVLEMTPDVRRDALEYLAQDSLIVDVEMTGRPPTGAWSMSVDVCFQASARYQYDYAK